MPGLLSGWQPPTHQGYTAVIRREEMLEIPNSTDRAHVTWNKEGKSLPQFAYKMLGLDDDVVALFTHMRWLGLTGLTRCVSGAQQGFASP